MMNESINENENVLEKYGRNIVSLAKDGKIDPVIGRSEEIQRLIQILSRRTKKNCSVSFFCRQVGRRYEVKSGATKGT